MSAHEPEQEFRPVGRLVEASNATFLVEDAAGERFVYKPVRGEAPLWDFPTATLGRREVAAYELSHASGFDVVPETRMIAHGPFGAGSLQRWVDVRTIEVPVEADEVFDDTGDDGPTGRDGRADAGPLTEVVGVELVHLMELSDVPDDWFGIVVGSDEDDNDLALAHPDDPALRRLALFDVVINNADRKGAHILAAADGRVLGVDHGVCFHQEDKLRTVLWGFAGETLTTEERHLVQQAADAALSGVLDRWLSPAEVRATHERALALLVEGTFPLPGDRWPVIPWPPI